MTERRPLQRFRLDGGPMGGVYYSLAHITVDDPLPPLVEVMEEREYTEITEEFTGGRTVERKSWLKHHRYARTDETYQGWPIYRFKETR